MKHERLVYGIGLVIIIIGVLMKILHLPGSAEVTVIYRVTFVGVFFYMAIHNSRMKKRIAELEAQLSQRE